MAYNPKRICVLLLFLALSLALSTNANMEQFPINITVAVTGFTNVEKADCNDTMNTYGGGSQAGLDQYIKNKIDANISGFYRVTISFDDYVKNVLPNEWVSNWLPESLRAGAMATKLAPWNTIKTNFPFKKWSKIGADVVDFTCDQTYKNGSETTTTNTAINNTWNYYAIYNSSGTETVLNAQYFDGDYSNKKYNGTRMAQNGSQYWAQSGKPWEWIINYYYDNTFLAKNVVIGDTVSAKIVKGQTWKFYLNLTGNEAGFKTTLTSFVASADLDLTIRNSSGVIVTSDTGLSYSKKLNLADPVAGVWTIEVYNNDVFMDSNFGLSTTEIYATPEQSGSQTGGINFTSLNLNYISTCDSNNLNFVMKGTEANVSAGDIIINTTNATINAMDYFLTGLVIPNHKIWITMDVIPGNSYLGYQGDTSKVYLNLKKTRLGQALLEADVKLKFDQFGQAAEAYERAMLQNWINMVQASPYWSQIQAKNFNSYPTGIRRTWIYPTKLEAQGDNCTVYLTNLTLNISYVWDSISLDLSPYAFSPEIVNDLNNRLAEWKQEHIQGHYSNVTNTTIWKINNAPEYAELRRAAASLALAQWYKQQPLDKVPFGDIIDSSNISGLEISFNEGYWNGQAWQYLYTLSNAPSFLPGSWWWDYYGGIKLTLAEPNITGELNNQTEELMANASQYSYVQENQTIYFATEKKPFKPDLVPLAIGMSYPMPDANQNVTISVLVSNEGTENTTNVFNVHFFSQYTYPNGYTVQNLIGNASIAGLNVGEIKGINVTWSKADIGTYVISAEVDYYNNVTELSELNNKANLTLQVVDPAPTAYIVSPVNGYTGQKDELISLIGYGTDYKDYELNESLYNWTSDVDGYLGNGTALYKNLSLGDHVITFTVQDSEGKKDTKQILLSVVPSQPPVATISSPKAGQVFQEGETIYLSGAATDHEDGTLSGSSLIWNSSINGILGTGNSFYTVSLSPGTHNLTFTAQDSSGVVDKEAVTIVVEESSPNVTINSPQNNSNFFYTQSNVTFNGTVADPHEGDISSKLNWTSSMDGPIGTGALFNKVISQGTHLISAFVKDGLGLTGLSQIYLTIFSPLPPTISIITPTTNQQITNGNQITFKASASDPEAGSLSGNSIVWNSSINGNFGNGTEVYLNNLTVGVHTITVIATDADNLSTQVSINLTVNSAAPVPNIISPSAGSAFSEGQPILFNGTASDLEEGYLSGSSLKWYDENTLIGINNTLSVSNLTKGTHTIVLNATDSHNTSAVDVKIVTIVGIGNNTLNSFSDGSSTKILNYSSTGTKVVYVKLPKNANITNATLQIEGLSYEE